MRSLSSFAAIMGLSLISRVSPLLHSVDRAASAVVSPLLGILISTVSLPASTEPEPEAQKPQPKIEFESTAFDFGKVKAGQPLTHDFVFTNTGTATLEVTDVKPGCGCTTAGAWDKAVLPGKTGIIPLKFSPGGFSGPFAKSTTVTCNDSARTNVMLQLNGTVWRPIEIVPTQAIFTFPAEQQTSDTKVLRILSNLEEPVTLSDLQCSNKSFRVELKTVQPGKEFELAVTVLPPLDASSTFVPITIKTSSPEAPVLSASVYAVLQPAVTVTPHQIVLPPGPLAKAFTASVAIHNGSTSALKLSEAKADSPDVEVRIQRDNLGQSIQDDVAAVAVEAGKQVTLAASFPVGFLVKPEQKLEVSVKSDHPKIPVIRVPVVRSEAEPALAAMPVVRQPASSVSPVTRVVPTRPAPPVVAQ